MLIKGSVWRFGDNIDTDVLAPGHYMKLPPEELAQHTLEAIDPDFAPNVKPGDILVAGANFGLGSSREQAAISLRMLGLGAVLAKGFARIFYRNALNIGLPVLFFPAADEVSAGEALEIDPVAGLIRRASDGATWQTEGIPDHLMVMIADGGLMPHLKNRLAAG